MNRQTLTFFAVAVAFFVHSFPQPVSAQISCLNNGNYTRNSTYAANLNATFSLLTRVLRDSGFANASVGDGADRANAAILCRADAQLDECRSCLQESGDEMLRSCPNQMQAVSQDYRCMTQYSNDIIYGAMANKPIWSTKSDENATSPDEFENAASGLLERLRNEAAAGDEQRKVAAGNASVPDFMFKTVFALVQCSPDMTKENCTRCLVNAYGNIPDYCEGKEGCRIITPSCNLRFEVFPFVNETRLRELEVVPPPSFPPSSPSGNGDDATLTVIIIVVPTVFGLILAVSAFTWLRKRKARKTTMEVLHHKYAGEISTPESLQYLFRTVKAATNDFSDDNKLGQGGFGAVYQGKLPNGMEIAVKRLSMNSGQGDLEFKNEVLLLAKLQHRNLVRLLGFAIEGKEKLLIYELVRNASLDFFIFDKRSRLYLDWDRRYKIIGGIVRGILYLHEDSRLRIIHRDLKAGNILLDGEMNPKIADFGMARLFGQGETQGNTSQIVGTYGYMPPEYIIQGHFSIKSDVFSFGVLVLEIISGRKNNGFQSSDNGEDLLSFAWENWREGRAARVVDPSLRSGAGSMSEIVRCIHIGLLCVQEDAAERPTMASVAIMLSSSLIRLEAPSEPAFYVPGSSASRIEGFNSDDLKRAAGQSGPSSNQTG